MPVENKTEWGDAEWESDLRGGDMRKTLVLGILFFTLVSLTWGQAPAPVGVRGQDLLYACRDAKPDSYFGGLCNGMLYVSAVLIREQCPSAGATVEIKKKVVIRYLENHPEQLDQLDVLLIQKALVEAYSCSDKKGRGDTGNATGTPLGQ
jgi:hypothetical protein